MNELEIMKYMSNIEYGWVDKQNNIHYEVDENFSDTYRLQSPEETLSNKVGVCWDQVELETYYFNKTNIEYKTYFIAHYDNNKCPTHTFLVFKKNNLYYWFEHSWNIFKGIHKYNNLNELLIDIKNKFIKYELNNNYNSNNLLLREYKRPSYGLSVIEFYNHCESFPIIENI